MIYVLILSTIAIAVWALLLLGKEKELKTRSQLLDQYDASLSDARDRVEADQKTLDARYREIADMIGEKNAFTVEDSYTVTDSDLMKYCTDKAIRSHAQNKIALAIAHDIMRKVPPEEYVNEEGKTVLTYKFKIRNVLN